MQVADAVQEAAALYEYCKEDREKLTEAGLNWELAEDLPVRHEVLARLQSIWKSKHLNWEECEKEWHNALPLARKPRSELKHDFKHAFHLDSNARASLKEITKGRTNAALILSLFSLSELGNNYKAELENIGMDINKLDKAKETCAILSKLQSMVKIAAFQRSGEQELRNKAFYHLKEAVTEVRRVGKHVFFHDEQRYKGYLSEFIRKKKRKSKKKRDKQ